MFKLKPMKKDLMKKLINMKPEILFLMDLGLSTNDVVMITGESQQLVNYYKKQY